MFNEQHRGNGQINEDLTAETFDLTKCATVHWHSDKSALPFMGDTKAAVRSTCAREIWHENGFACRPTPMVGPNADVLKPWVNGMDLTRRLSGQVDR